MRWFAAGYRFTRPAEIGTWISDEMRCAAAIDDYRDQTHILR